ncbi:MAG: hypothetical protein EZS28_037120 [Streblomastix strix]|uniref:Uncharacterized protein n=1 Tax=Streblomastix strix TaxID=222440 RepID=A0A5J4UB14_9EUKA|nr:MAG: hypothetical protein EZS28_037120 [Streblomastix strix]
MKQVKEQVNSQSLAQTLIKEQPIEQQKPIQQQGVLNPKVNPHHIRIWFIDQLLLDSIQKPSLKAITSKEQGVLNPKVNPPHIRIWFIEQLVLGGEAKYSLKRETKFAANHFVIEGFA